MMTCLKYLLPISCVLLLGVSLWQAAVPVAVLWYTKYVLAAACVLLLAWMLVKVFTTPSKLPATVAPGLLGPGRHVFASRN
jgi:NADH-quinone oxidoreductase subunit H